MKNSFVNVLLKKEYDRILFLIISSLMIVPRFIIERYLNDPPYSWWHNRLYVEIDYFYSEYSKIVIIFIIIILIYAGIARLKDAEKKPWPAFLYIFPWIPWHIILSLFLLSRKSIASIKTERNTHLVNQLYTYNHLHRLTRLYENKEQK